MTVRKELKKDLGKCGAYVGIVSRFGQKPAYKGYPIPTICLVDVKTVDGKPICDHLWFIVGKQIERLCLSAGQTIKFEARGN